MSVAATVSDARPPPAVLRMVNPVMRALICSRAGRVLPDSLAVLRFRGRRSGRVYRIVVGWQDAGGERVVFSPARWTANLRGGAPVSVGQAGRWRDGTATLVDDPEEVAAAIRRVLADGTPARAIGLRMPPGHVLTADDVRAMGRKMIRFAPAGDVRSGP